MPRPAVTPGPPTARTKIRRLAGRGRYDERTIAEILDEGFVCHLGVFDMDHPLVIPTAYGRVGELLYVHGAAGNHTLRTLCHGARACLTVTLVDGVVLSRSAFHHSVNYRSVMLFGTASEVLDPSEKFGALMAIVEHAVPGRSRDVRPPTTEELRATRVLSLPIDEASAKVRSGGPREDPDDLALDVWAGQIPLATVAGAPLADAGVAVPAPRYVTGYRRP
jgi:uncharacterized protein